ncbi:MAG: ribosome maturation factor RimM [Bacteroidota bacterium]|jgi:16S rRNA processing protein RimM
MIAVGRITRGVGLKGELNVAVLTDTMQRFEKLKTVWVGADESQTVKHTITAVRVTSSAVVLKLKEIDSRTAADSLRGQLVFVAAKDAVVPNKGSYFIHDIIGMNVETESGKTIGTVREVMELPANDVWVVGGAGGEILIPAIKDVIRSVDVQRRRVVIRPLEGLLE